MPRRLDIEVLDLGGEGGVAGLLEGADAMRLQPVRCPDPAPRARRRRPPGQRPGRSVRRLPRRLRARQREDLRHRLRRQRRLAWLARLVAQQAVHPGFSEPLRSILRFATDLRPALRYFAAVGKRMRAEKTARMNFIRALGSLRATVNACSTQMQDALRVFLPHVRAEPSRYLKSSFPMSRVQRSLFLFCRRPVWKSGVLSALGRHSLDYLLRGSSASTP